MKIYLDNNRVTPVDESVAAKMNETMKELHGDLYGMHYAGAKSRKIYNEALSVVYRVLHADKKDTITFTSGAAEANSAVFQSVYLHYILTGRKNNIIVGERESRSVMQAARFLESQGCRVNYLPVNGDGIIDAQSLLDYITPRTALVSVGVMDAQSGALNPLDEIAKICSDYQVPLHSDASCALGKVEIDMQSIGIDYLSISSETIHAPAGTGALYIREGAELLPLIHGTRAGAERLRGGPLNLVGIAGFAKAVEAAADALEFEMEDVRELRDRLEESLKSIDAIEIFVPWAYRAPNTLLCAFEGVDSESLLYELDQSFIAAYSPSVNPWGEWEAKSIVKATDRDRNLRFSTIGFALSRYNNSEEIEKTARAVKEAVEYLRSISMGKELK